MRASFNAPGNRRGEEVDATSKTIGAEKENHGIGHRVYKTRIHVHRICGHGGEAGAKRSGTEMERMSERIAQLMKKRKPERHRRLLFRHVYYSLGRRPISSPRFLPLPLFRLVRTRSRTMEDNRLYRPLSEYIGEPAGKKSFRSINGRKQAKGQLIMVCSLTQSYG